MKYLKWKLVVGKKEERKL